MAVTYGFYDSVQGDRRYNAEQMSSIFDGIIEDGIYQGYGEAFSVLPDETKTGITVGSGRAWFDHTWTLNDTRMAVPIPEAELILPRIDAVVIEVNKTTDVRANAIKIVKGTPDREPQKPELAKSPDLKQYPLAYLTRPASVSGVTDIQVENAIGTSDCPFVLGVLKVLSTDDFIIQWKAELNLWRETEATNWDEWKKTQQAAWDKWKSDNQDTWDAWRAENQKNWDEWLSTNQSTWNNWSQNAQEVYNVWYTSTSAEWDEFYNYAQGNENERIVRERAREETEAERIAWFESAKEQYEAGEFNAGFGSINATVDDTSGKPNVEVVTSGTNAAKDILFNFTGLKGEPGVVTDVRGFISFGIEADGILYVYYADDDNPPTFSYDEASGILYYETEGPEV